MAAETTVEKQRGRPFVPGQSGNPAGRPKGAKNKLTELFLSIVTEDFKQYGAEALSALRKEDPATYVRLVGALIPRELILQSECAPDVDYSALSFDEIAALVDLERRRRMVVQALSAS